MLNNKLQQADVAGDLNRFIYTICGSRLKKAIGTFASENAGMMRVENKEGIKFPSVMGLRHDHAVSVRIDEDNVYYTFVVSASFLAEGDADEATERMRIISRLRFSPEIPEGYRFDVLNVALEPKLVDMVNGRYDLPFPEIPDVGVPARQDLIADLHDARRREAEAERFLRRYCPAALEDPMPVPIREIAESMELKLLFSKSLSRNGSVIGKVIFQDQTETMYDFLDDEEEELLVGRGTVLVDPEAYLVRAPGALNFTIAHECYHWFGHRAYIDFHRLMQKLGLEDSGGNAAWNEMVWDKEYAKEDLLEIQSNAIAGRILMPKDMFIEKFREIDKLYGKTDDVSRTVDELASFYCVSRQACRIRLSELGLWDFDEEPGAQETVFVSPADAFGLYAGDPEFMELADSGAVIYHNNSYFYNKPEYIIWEEPRGAKRRRFHLTDYAQMHREESCVHFQIQHRRVRDGQDDGSLLRYDDSELVASAENINKCMPEQGRILKELAAGFEKQYQKKRSEHPSFCELVRELITEEYGTMEEYKEGLHEKEYRRSEKEFSDRPVKLSPLKSFCESTTLNEKYYNRIMNDMIRNPETATIICICVAFELDREASYDLLRAGGRCLKWDRLDMAYRFIIGNMIGEYYLEDINFFLNELGLPLLGGKKKR